MTVCTLNSALQPFGGLSNALTSLLGILHYSMHARYNTYEVYHSTLPGWGIGDLDVPSGIDSNSDASEMFSRSESTRCSRGGLFSPFLGPGCAGFVCV